MPVSGDTLTLTLTTTTVTLTIHCSQLFDRDKDGVLNIREFQAINKCLGLHLKIEKVINNKNINSVCKICAPFQATELAGSVTCDNTGYSVSFNEFLKIVSNERKSQPDEMSLIEMFR